MPCSGRALWNSTTVESERQAGALAIWTTASEWFRQPFERQASAPLVWF